MSNLAYLLVWLVLALMVIAMLSATIARSLRAREIRHLKALELLDGLARYSDWAASQRRAVFFEGENEEGTSPLEQARTISQGWFPELAGDMVEILIVHNRLVDFLWNQQLLRFKDPEAWLESDHDARFVELWRQHRYAVEGIESKLRALAHVQETEHKGRQLA